MIQVELEYFPPNPNQQAKQLCWALWFNSEIIVEKTIAPEFHAAKYLLDHGFSGPFETVDRKSKIVRMRFKSIEAVVNQREQYEKGG